MTSTSGLAPSEASAATSEHVKAVQPDSSENVVGGFRSWQYLWRAINDPAPCQPGKGFLRQWLLWPRVFDVASCLIQLRWRKRLPSVQPERPFEDPAVRKSYAHNARVTSTKVVTTSRRAEPLYQILTTPTRCLTQERLLIIGPRNAQELLMAWLHGYAWKHIDAIDLYSAHPKIRVMNMEQMTFGEGAFDAMIMAHTLPYAKDVFRCLSEVHRVLTPGGRFVFNIPHVTRATGWSGNQLHGQELREMLRRLSFDLFHYHAFDKVSRDGIPQTTHVFGVQKRDGQSRMDRIEWS